MPDRAFEIAQGLVDHIEAVRSSRASAVSTAAGLQ